MPRDWDAAKRQGRQAEDAFQVWAQAIEVRERRTDVTADIDGIRAGLITPCTHPQKAWNQPLSQYQAHLWPSMRLGQLSMAQIGPYPCPDTTLVDVSHIVRKSNGVCIWSGDHAGIDGSYGDGFPFPHLSCTVMGLVSAIWG